MSPSSSRPPHTAPLLPSGGAGHGHEEEKGHILLKPVDPWRTCSIDEYVAFMIESGSLPATSVDHPPGPPVLGTPVRSPCPPAGLVTPVRPPRLADPGFSPDDVHPGAGPAASHPKAPALPFSSSLPGGGVPGAVTLSGEKPCVTTLKPHLRIDGTTPGLSLALGSAPTSGEGAACFASAAGFASAVAAKVAAFAALAAVVAAMPPVVSPVVTQLPLCVNLFFGRLTLFIPLPAEVAPQPPTLPSGGRGPVCRGAPDVVGAAHSEKSNDLSGPVTDSEIHKLTHRRYSDYQTLARSVEVKGLYSFNPNFPLPSTFSRCGCPPTLAPALLRLSLRLAPPFSEVPVPSSEWED